MSQNVDIGLSFCLMVCRIRNFEKKCNKLQKLPVFCQKTKTRALKKNLRHASLDKKVFYTYLKCCTCR